MVNLFLWLLMSLGISSFGTFESSVHGDTAVGGGDTWTEGGGGDTWTRQGVEEIKTCGGGETWC